MYRHPTPEPEGWKKNRHAVLERCCQYEEIGLTPEEVKELVTGLRSMKAVVLTGTDAEEWIAYQDGKH